MGTIPRQNKTFLICALLSLAVLVVFRQTLTFDFIDYDDALYVVKNPSLLYGLTKEGLAWAAGSLYAANWHPLTLLSFLVDYELYGMNPGGYHLTNTLIHLLGGLFLFFAFREMTGNSWKSCLVAAIFLLHPLHVEPVASVAGRKDVLSGFFWALTILAYARYTRKPVLWAYLLTCFFFILGLMSKATVVTLPLVLLLLDYWPLNRFNEISEEHSAPFDNRLFFPKASPARLLTEKIPFLLLSGVAGLLTWKAQTGAAAIAPLFELDFTTRVGNVAHSFLMYIGKTIRPVDLSFFYPYHPAGKTGWILPAVLLFTAVGALGLRLRKSAPWFIVGWLWFVLTMLPTIGIVQAGSQSMADRYTYIPMIGLSVIAVWGSGIYKPSRKGNMIFAATWLVVLSLLIADSKCQTTYWQNSRTLFEHALSTTEGNYLAHNNLGAFFMKQNQYDSAERHFREALRIKPGYADAGINLAQIMLIKGKTVEAETSFRNVLNFHPDNDRARRLLCDFLLTTGKNREAIVCYDKAAAASPDNPELQNNLAVALAGNNQIDEAIIHLERALRLQPGFKDAKRNLDLLRTKNETTGKKTAASPKTP